MRSFRFDPATGRAMLNGKPYFLRGTNVCAYRFFEDAERGDQPWRAEWVRRLHQQFKSMHWNSIRYCIGFPPEIVVRHRRRGGLPDPGRVPDLAAGQGPGEPDGREDHPRVHRVDARAVEPSVRGHLGRPERKPHARDRQGPAGGAPPGPLEPAVGQRLGRAADRPDCVESHPYLFSRGWSARQGNAVLASRRSRQVSGTPRLQNGPAEAQRAGHHQRVRLAVAQPRRQRHLPDRTRSTRALLGPELDGRAAARPPRPLRGGA